MGLLGRLLFGNSGRGTSAAPPRMLGDAPNFYTESGLSQSALLRAKETMLEMINNERRRNGLSGVTIGSNPAAQLHAGDMRANCFFSHWGSDGLKPYMRYSFAGGAQYDAENIAGHGYCPADEYRYGERSLLENIELAMSGLMNSPGHRETILTWYHRKVNLGFSYRKPNLWAVQHFEGDYVEFNELPNIRGTVMSFNARLKNGVSARGSSCYMYIGYDPPPRRLTRGQLQRTYSYASGYYLASIHRDRGYSAMVPETPHVDPYHENPSLPASTSYEEDSALREQAKARCGGSCASYRVDGIRARRWRLSGNSLSVSADIGELLLRHGFGVYTVSLYGELRGESIPISSHSIFMPPLPMPSV